MLLITYLKDIKMKFKKERKEIVKFAKLMSKEGLIPGTSGNISIYKPEEKLVLITPSGLSYDKLKKRHIVLMDLDGNVVEGKLKPSSEYLLHTYIYKNKIDARALVHTHSVFATAMSVLREPIKPVHYVIADANAYEIPCAPYKRYGTEDLARVALETIGDSKALLLANHGMLAYDESLEKAYSLAKEVEYIAEIQYRARAMGEPVLLTKEELDQVSQAFKSYGQVK